MFIKPWRYRVSNASKQKKPIYLHFLCYLYIFDILLSTNPIFTPDLPFTYLPIRYSNNYKIRKEIGPGEELPMHHHHSTAHKHPRKTL